MKKDIFGFLKPLVDVHTMGVYTIINLLKDCGYTVHFANDNVNKALENIHGINNYGLVKKWIIDNGITRLGFSYRLDPNEGCDYFMSLLSILESDNMFSAKGGPLTEISFAGLPDTCALVKGKTNGRVLVFPGNESPIESLLKYRVPDELLPKSIINNSEYDSMIWDFARQWSMHGTEHTARQGVTRQGCQQFATARIDRHIGTTSNDIGCITMDVFFLTKQRHRSVAGIQGHTYHLGAFGNEQAFVRIEPMTQLCLGERGINFHSGLSE